MSEIIDKELNVDSLWLIPERDKGGKHANVYHGNFVPQIPNQLIRRYTNEGDCVLDMFMGSGTTLFECETLKRNFIGFDINQEAIDYVHSKMIDSNDIKYQINNCDVTDSVAFSKDCLNSLNKIGKSSVDFLISHPPYLDIINFTKQDNDLSNISDSTSFIAKFTLAMQNALEFLKINGYFALVVGDVYKKSEVVPLGFYLMNAVKNNFKVKLKGIIIKNIEGNKGKLGTYNIWKYRALKSDYFLFKHEYIFVFKKEF